MRHVIVQRFAVLLALLFVGAAAVFTWMVGPEPSARSSGPEPPPRAAAIAFEERCGTCHAPVDLSAVLREGGAPKRLDIERFLEQHGDAPPEEDQLILDYLGAGPP